MSELTEQHTEYTRKQEQDKIFEERSDDECEGQVNYGRSASVEDGCLYPATAFDQKPIFKRMNSYRSQTSQVSNTETETTVF